MSTGPTGPRQRLVFNGIDALSGLPVELPTSARHLAARIRAMPRDPSVLHEVEESRQWMEQVRRGPDRRPGPDVDPMDLASAGWAVVLPAAPQLPRADLEEALRPLLARRREQAGRYYRREEYRRGETKESFLARLKVSKGAADPREFPYYVLLVGGPDEIPPRFQYLLDMQYAVGRIGFDRLADYAAYARSVVRAERRTTLDLRPEAVLFSARHPGDGAMDRCHRELATPLYESIRRQRPAWTPRWAGAGKADLRRLLGGEGADAAPAFLFTAAHGLWYPSGHRDQLTRQGAILCSGWKRGEPVGDDHRFGAEDVPDGAPIHGTVVFMFGCYSAGTPARDNFPPRALRNARPLARAPFVAPLARRLLSLPTGGALAVLGHYDRAWTTSFADSDGRGCRHVESMAQFVLDGYPVGHAMDWINERYAELATEVADALDTYSEDIPEYSERPGRLVQRWRAHNDARNFMVLGDPAVRLLTGPRRAALGATPAQAPRRGSNTSKGAVRDYLGAISQDSVGDLYPSPAEMLHSGRSPHRPSNRVSGREGR